MTTVMTASCWEAATTAFFFFCYCFCFCYCWPVPVLWLTSSAAVCRLGCSCISMPLLFVKAGAGFSCFCNSAGDPLLKTAGSSAAFCSMVCYCLLLPSLCCPCHCCFGYFPVYCHGCSLCYHLDLLYKKQARQDHSREYFYWA